MKYSIKFCIKTFIMSEIQEIKNFKKDYAEHLSYFILYNL